MYHELAATLNALHLCFKLWFYSKNYTLPIVQKIYINVSEMQQNLLRANSKKMVHGMSWCNIFMYLHWRIFTSTSTYDRYRVFFFCRLGTWGVCFTYAAFFSIKGLVAAGRTYENSPSIRKACQFILSKQLCTGGWGESHLSNETQVIQTFLLIACLNPSFYFNLVGDIWVGSMVCLPNSY